MVPFFSGIPHFLQLMMIELGMAVAPIILIATSKAYHIIGVQWCKLFVKSHFALVFINGAIIFIYNSLFQRHTALFTVDNN